MNFVDIKRANVLVVSMLLPFFHAYERAVECQQPHDRQKQLLPTRMRYNLPPTQTKFNELPQFVEKRT